MTALTRSVKAEIDKLRTVRSTFVLVSIGFFLTIAFGALVAFGPRGRRGAMAGSLAPPHGSHRWFLDAMSIYGSIALPFALVLGVLIITGEYRHKTVTSTFLAEPRRTLVVGSKLVVSVLAGLCVGVLAAAGALILGFIMVAGSHGTSSEMLGQYENVLGFLAGAALYAVYGTGLGALFKNQVAALIVGLGVDLVALPIISGTVPGVARWLPGEAAQALAHAVQRTGFVNTSVHLLPWWGGVGMLIAYGVVLAGLGAATAIRADVT